MSLVVEDGTGLSTAESYVSVADADTYHALWGNAGWTGSTAVKEVALRRAARYLDATYGQTWQGSRVNSDQALNWPRFGAYTREGFNIGSDALPASLVTACAEMALLALSEDIYPDLSGTGVVSSESASVGSLSTSTTYIGGKSPLKSYRAVDALVSELLNFGGGNTELQRG